MFTSFAKAKFKRRGDEIEEADLAMGKFVRLRDCLWTKKNPEWGLCISCGGLCQYKYDESIDPKRCGSAGHYVPRANMALRWDMENVNLQCRYCNEFLDGNEEGYKEGIIAKYGQATLNRLEQMRNVRAKHSTAEIIELRDFFREAKVVLRKQFRTVT